MVEANTHGLTRYIPADVARAVRARCGFGCVVCGSALVDYEHFDPEFKDAESHEANGIILLCPNHHRSKGAFIARSTIAEAAASSHCKREGFAWTTLDIRGTSVEIGPCIACGCKIILEVRGQPLIWFNAPEAEGGPNRLNLIVRASDGSDLVRIVDNVWHASHAAEDVRLVAGDTSGRLEVADEDGPVFKAYVYPPNSIFIEVYRSWENGRHYALGRDTAGTTLFSIDGRQVMAPGSDGSISFGCYAVASIY